MKRNYRIVKNGPYGAGYWIQVKHTYLGFMSSGWRQFAICYPTLEDAQHGLDAHKKGDVIADNQRVVWSD